MSVPGCRSQVSVEGAEGAAAAGASTRGDPPPSHDAMSSSRLAGKLIIKSFDAIASIPRAAWERTLPGEPESWEFYAAVEGVPPPGFKLGAMAAFADDAIVAVAPLFRTAYRIDTPLQGRLRQIGDWVHARWPRLVSFPVLGIGSPMSDNCALGFAPGLSDADCAYVCDGLLGHLAQLAKADKSALLAVKSLDRSAEVLDGTLRRHGYKCVTSVPLAMLDLPYRSLDQYLASLPQKTGAYFRRKMRSANKVRIEFRSSVAGLEQQIAELFDNTRKQSKVDYGDFERLDPQYFPKVVHGMGDKAQFMLCWQGDELLSFQLFLVGRDRVLAKQIGMQYPQGRELNLYFVNWLKLIEFAIQHRIPSVEMGATTYATKLLFGGYLERRWLHFRFRSGLWNRVLDPVAPLFDFEKNDPELKKLDAEVKAYMGPRLSRLAQHGAGDGHTGTASTREAEPR
jgi:Acetyltransferase (GNAT) domain